MKNFTILLTVIALTALISCSGIEEGNWYGNYDDYVDTSSDDSSASSDTDADKTNTTDSTDPADTANTDAANTDAANTDAANTDAANTDKTDTTDSGADTADSGADTTDSGADTTDSGADTTDSGADTTDSGADTTDSGADTTDSGADTTDSGADTTDSGADTTDSGADTADSGADTADSGADTADSGADTADSGADTADTTDTTDTTDTGDTEPVCTPNCEGKWCGDDDGCGGRCDVCADADKFCDYNYECIPTQCATVTEINLNTSLVLDPDSIQSHSSQSAIFTTSYTPNTGSNATDTFFIKFANLDTYDGTFYLENKNWSDNSGFFLYVKEDGGNKIYFQKNGTVETHNNIYDDGWSETETVSAKLTGVILEEVNIENNISTPAQGSACLIVKNTTVEFKDSNNNGWLSQLLEALFGDGWN